LAALQAHLDRALAGQGGVAFVCGEAGGGKTTLAVEFANRALAAHRDLLVAVGSCDARLGLGDPYQPFREALRLLGGATEIFGRRLREGRSLIGEALLEAGPDLPGTLLPAGDQVPGDAAGSPDLGVAQAALFEQVTEVLRAVARRRPLILILDDLHWVDAQSAGLLFHLGRHLAERRLLIVGTYRPEEVHWTEAASSRQHSAAGQGESRRPLLPVIHGLQREFGQFMVDLDQANGRAFVDAFLDKPAGRSVPRHFVPAYRRQSAIYRRAAAEHEGARGIGQGRRRQLDNRPRPGLGADTGSGRGRHRRAVRPADRPVPGDPGGRQRARPGIHSRSSGPGFVGR
jgi:hypothetical protein